MLELTKTRHTDGSIRIELTVPADKLEHVEQAIYEALEPGVPAEEAFSDMGPGNVLAGIRRLNNLSQSRLAERIGIHRANAGAMERGKRTIGLDMAKRLGQALDVPYKVFL